MQVVSLCTTLHAGHHYSTTRRMVKEQGSWTQQQVQRPKAVQDYNQHMGGVDKSDQIIGTYNVLLKSMRLFFFTSIILYWVSIHA